MIDLSIYLTAAAGGVPILFLVFGLVQLLKKLTRPDGGQLLTGNALLIASCAWGLILGAGFMLATTPPQPVSGWTAFGYWFGVLAYGLGLGFFASLFWDALKAIIEAALARMLQQALQNQERS